MGRVVNLGVIGALLAFATSCGAEWPKGAAKRHADVHVAIQNSGDTKIYEAGVYMGDYRSTGGVIAPGATKTYVHWRHPITTNAVVRWRDSREGRKERTISLIGLYDPKVEGVLTFSIAGTNVTGHFHKWNPRDSR